MQPLDVLRISSTKWLIVAWAVCLVGSSPVGWAVEPDSSVVKPGLVFLSENDHPSRSIPGPCVILVPGLLASDSSMACISQELEKQSFETAIFRYTSQAGIVTAAEQLSKELTQLQSSRNVSRVVIVTHSMGGLVARKCLEDPTLAPKNVTQLIMIAPPNQGSAIAKFTAADIAKDFRFTEALDKDSLSLVDDALGSFFGRAKEELCPNSETLLALNACDRASGIRYCIIAGTAGPIPGKWVSTSLFMGRLLLGSDPDAAAAMQSAGKLLTLDEWTQGRGDGVVSVASAKLKGVDDFITLPFTHNSFGELGGETTQEVTADVLREVMTRIAQAK